MLSDQLAACRQLLPTAFVPGADIVWPERYTERRFSPDRGLPEEVERSLTTLEDLIATDFDPRSSSSIVEFGTEVLGVYVSFHRPVLVSGSKGAEKWGIFLMTEALDRTSEELAKATRLPSSLASWLMERFVLDHEFFHYRIDLQTLQAEMFDLQPLYNDYRDAVYETTVGTSVCVEESLANRAAFDKAVHPKHVTNKKARDVWERWLRGLVDASPPGYRDCFRDRDQMRQRMLGQLRTGMSGHDLDVFSAAWLGGRIPIPDWECPCYSIGREACGPDGEGLRVKANGEIWEIHKNDADPWPSKPHAHNVDTREKLDLVTGGIWRQKSDGRPARLMRRKELDGFLRVALSLCPDLPRPVSAALVA